MGRDSPVARRLGGEERPCLLLRPKTSLISGIEDPVPVLERVRVRSLRIAKRVGSEPRLGHAARCPQRFDLGDVDRAPDAARPPRRESLDECLVVQPFLEAVDPAEAERLVDRFGVREAFLPAPEFPEPDPKLGNLRVVPLEPAAECRGRREERRFHAFRQDEADVSRASSTTSCPSTVRARARAGPRSSASLSQRSRRARIRAARPDRRSS